MDKKNYQKGEIIFREGDNGDFMYIILTGRVQVFKKINNEKIILAILEKGDFFGEMCLFLPTERTATIETLEDTQLMLLTKENLLHEIEMEPDFGLKMITTYAKRLKEAHGIISELAGVRKSLEIMYSIK